jgi:NitT/TauT family transport system substrate-binding protein
VTVVDTTNSNIVTLMATNQIDGAWVPEPWGATILSTTASHILVDERTLWPGGDFSTAELIVSTSFLTAHPDVVSRILTAHVQETEWIASHLSQAETLVAQQIAKQTDTTQLNQTIVSSAFSRLSFTYNPLKSSVDVQAQDAYQLGFLGTTPTDISNLFDLNLLNQVLTQQGLPLVS